MEYVWKTFINTSTFIQTMSIMLVLEASIFLVKSNLGLTVDNIVTISNTKSEYNVSVAKSFSKKNDIVLLSPACASFGLFVNEFDRGDQFKKIISKL